MQSSGGVLLSWGTLILVGEYLCLGDIPILGGGVGYSCPGGGTPRHDQGVPPEQDLYRILDRTSNRTIVYPPDRILDKTIDRTMRYPLLHNREEPVNTLPTPFFGYGW